MAPGVNRVSRMFSRTTFALFSCLALLPGSVGAQEFRALWADTFHAGLRNSSETSALIAAARTAKCNAVVVEVRKRGDAYYRNGLEPVAFDVEAGFDPLADLIQKGHGGSPRIEVHAWLVTYNIWNSQNSSPVQPTHPYNLHPDWLSRDNTGATWAGSSPTSGNYQFDQGHPAVQQHTFDVVMDILGRYDVDGIHFDYVRYSDHNSSNSNQPWGYNPVALARYKKLKNVSTTPAPTDPAWLQWRRDQVTALVRKVYLNAWAMKPNVRISAALIAYDLSAPIAGNLASWQSKPAYARVLQDWRAWMEEGILDLGCPMDYRRIADNSSFEAWGNFAKDSQYNRAAAVGMGWYLNSIPNTISQIKTARTASPVLGRRAAGVIGYSYAVPNKDGISQTETWASLTDDATAETYDPGGTPVFATAVATPAMPWKSNATKGHVMGDLRPVGSGAAFDGATVALSGPTNRTMITDATGFFGAVDLPVGNYTLSVNVPGYTVTARSFTVAGAAVSLQSVQLASVPLRITSVLRSLAGDTMTITWASVPGRRYRVEGSNNLQQWTTVAGGISAVGGSTSYQWMLPPSHRGQAFVRIAEE